MKIKVREIVKKYKMIEENDRVLVGVSGGVDSMALLNILLELREDINFEIHIGHVNHGVRGKEALRDQDFVKNQAKLLNLPFYTTNVDMDGYAKKHKITSEEAGRILRYGFFNNILKELGGGKIAVAHNLNDQAETLLMRFMRGTGLDGLRGIEYVNDNIIRPILGITRYELETYIKDKEIEIVQDHTNFQPIYTRNRIRLEIIPYIEKYFNPNIIKTLERTSNLAEIDSNFLENYSKNKYKSLVKTDSDEEIAFNYETFIKEDIAIQQRLLRQAILNIKGSLQGVSEAQISNLLDFFKFGETGKQVNIISNIVGEISYENLIIKRETSNIKDYFFFLNNDEKIKEIGYKISVKSYKITDRLQIKKSKDSHIFDEDKIRGQLAIRNRRSGDRFTPFGMKGSKKIKDFFIDEKVPRENRDKIPLIVDEENIIWVVGYRINDIYKVTSETKNIIEIKVEKLNRG